MKCSLRLCQSDRGGLRSVDSHLSTLLLKWQRLLNWSNMASAGERKTLPHTDRKHKHTLILLTRCRPRSTETHTNTHIVSSMHLCSSEHKERHIPNERGVHNHKHVHTIARMCAFIHPHAYKCIDKPETSRPHTKANTHACTVWKYRSGRQVD